MLHVWRDELQRGWIVLLEAALRDKFERNLRSAPWPPSVDLGGRNSSGDLAQRRFEIDCQSAECDVQRRCVVARGAQDPERDRPGRARKGSHGFGASRQREFRELGQCRRPDWIALPPFEKLGIGATWAWRKRAGQHRANAWTGELWAASRSAMRPF